MKIFFPSVIISVIAATLFCGGYYLGNKSICIQKYNGKIFPFHGSYPTAGIPLAELYVNKHMIKQQDYNRLIKYDMIFIDNCLDHLKIIKQLSNGKNREIIEKLYSEICHYRGNDKEWQEEIKYYGNLGLQDSLRKLDEASANKNL